MEVVFRLVARTPQEKEPAIISWFVGKTSQTMTGLELRTLPGNAINTRADAAALDVLATAMATPNFPPVSVPLYCAAPGCSRLLFALGAGTPAAIHAHRPRLCDNGFLHPLREDPLGPQFLRQEITLVCDALPCFQVIGKLRGERCKELRRKHPTVMFHRQCTNCLKVDDASAPFLRCRRCREDAYCSPECAARHWPVHKLTCQKREQ